MHALEFYLFQVSDSRSPLSSLIACILKNSLRSLSNTCGMLALSPLRSSNAAGANGDDQRDRDEFLLEDINFDDIFVGFDDADMLPDLEINPSDIFADFSFSSGDESAAVPDGEKANSAENESRGEDKGCWSSQGEVEVVSARTKEEKSTAPPENNGKSRKSTVATGNKVSQGKKKAKVQL